MVKSRVMETTLGYILDVMDGEFEELKEMMLDSIEGKKGKWYQHVERYRSELDISWEDLLRLDKKSLKRLVKTYDSDCWRRELEDKSSAKYYRAEKKEIRYETCYTND